MERGEFAELDHTADLGLDLWGSGPDAILEAAQRGLVGLLFGEPPDVDSREEREVRLEADSYPELLKAWLESLYRLLEDEGFVARSTRVVCAEPARFHAVVKGGVLPRAQVARASELKGVTYHELAFERAGDHWRARVILDV